MVERSSWPRKNLRQVLLRSIRTCLNAGYQDLTRLSAAASFRSRALMGPLMKRFTTTAKLGLVSGVTAIAIGIANLFVELIGGAGSSAFIIVCGALAIVGLYRAFSVLDRAG